MPALHALRELSADAARRRRRRRTSSAGLDADDGGSPPGLLHAEWELFSHPTTTRRDDDFLAVPTPAPEQLERPAPQRRPGRAAPRGPGQPGLHPDRRSRARRPAARSLRPARLGPGRLGARRRAPRRGHLPPVPRGISCADWCRQVDDHPDIVALRAAYGRWRDNRDLDPDPAFPVARYLLVHTLSHLLLRQVALECGYSSASIRERLYVGTPDQPTAGVLLSTAASDSEGTLGGLVALGEARFLGRLARPGPR